MAYINDRGEIVRDGLAESATRASFPSSPGRGGWSVTSLRVACAAAVIGWVILSAIIAHSVAGAKDATWYDNNPDFNVRLDKYRVDKKAYDESSWINRTFLQSQPQDPSSGRSLWFGVVFLASFAVTGLVGGVIVVVLFEMVTGEGLVSDFL